MVIKVYCDKCGNEKFISPSDLKKKKKHFCNKVCYAEFQKTCPSNTGRTRFKKGIPSVNKDKFIKENPKRRRQWYYRKIAMKATCNRCSNDGKVVHHVDGDYKNDDINNLECLCHYCHTQEHNLKQYLPEDGGWGNRK